MGWINCKYIVTINDDTERKYNCNTAMKVACYLLLVVF